MSAGWIASNPERTPVFSRSVDVRSTSVFLAASAQYAATSAAAGPREAAMDITDIRIKRVESDNKLKAYVTVTFDVTDGGKPLMQALKLRATSRAFAKDPLPDQTLANLLWAACGINRPDGKRTLHAGPSHTDAPHAGPPSQQKRNPMSPTTKAYKGIGMNGFSNTVVILKAPSSLRMLLSG